jgi:hypothetical protein
VAVGQVVYLTQSDSTIPPWFVLFVVVNPTGYLEAWGFNPAQPPSWGNPWQIFRDFNIEEVRM